jgi:hypothetical protein
MLLLTRRHLAFQEVDVAHKSLATVSICLPFLYVRHLEVPPPPPLLQELELDLGLELEQGLEQGLEQELELELDVELGLEQAGEVAHAAPPHRRLAATASS